MTDADRTALAANLTAACPAPPTAGPWTACASSWRSMTPSMPIACVGIW